MKTLKTNEYMFATYAFIFLSFMGSFLSVFNIITILTTYQLYLTAKKIGMTPKREKTMSFFIEMACVLTLCITVLYLSIQL